MKVINSGIRFYLGDNNIFVTTKDGLVVYDEKCIELNKLNIIGAEYIGAYENSLLVMNESGKGYDINYLDLSFKIILETEDIKTNLGKHNQFIVIHKSASIYETRQNGVYDLSNQKILFLNKKCKSNSISGDFFYGIINSIIYSSDITTGRLTWQFDLHTLPPFKDREDVEYKAELVNIIGVYNEVVWFREKYGRLIGIDSKNGSLLHNLYFNELVGLPRFAPVADIIIFGDIHLDEQKGILKSLSYRHYWEIDLNTLTGNVKKDFGSIDISSWRIQRSKFYAGDKNLYFVGAKNGKSVNRAVGIFDTELCEIVWYDEPLAEKKFLFFTDVPQANDTLLGVLDSEKNLWIYEKNEISALVRLPTNHSL